MVLQYQGQEIDLSKPFHRLTPLAAIKKFAPNYTDEELNNPDFIRAELKRLGGEIPVDAGLGALQMALFEETAEAKLIEPTFIIDYPVEISPLARASDADPEITERLSFTLPAEKPPTGSPSSTIRTIRLPASVLRLTRRATATTKRCITMPTTSVLSNTVCPRPPAAASALTVS